MSAEAEMAASTVPGRDQLPTGLGWLDDRWGIGWRAVNLGRRLSVRRTARFASGYIRGVRHERPVFILGAPRSGTSMFFQLLRASQELGALPGEGHDIWRALHHPRWRGWKSDVVEKAFPGERRYVSARFYAHFSERRFVEKTPENSLRVPYLLDLFPDATFLVVQRNPCDVISSLIDGWREATGRYRSYFVPERLTIPGHPHPHQWRFALIDGWREYASRPVEEIAFAQWDACCRGIEAARASVDPSHWHTFRLEDAIEHPSEFLDRLSGAAGVSRDPRLDRRLDDVIARPVNALSPAAQEKWRLRNEAEIHRLLPRISDAAPGRGYAVDRETGACTPEAEEPA